MTLKTSLFLALHIIKAYSFRLLQVFISFSIWCFIWKLKTHSSTKLGIDFPKPWTAISGETNWRCFQTIKHVLSRQLIAYQQRGSETKSQLRKLAHKMSHLCDIFLPLPYHWFSMGLWLLIVPKRSMRWQMRNVGQHVKEVRMTIQHLCQAASSPSSSLSGLEFSFIDSELRCTPKIYASHASMMGHSERW